MVQIWLIIKPIIQALLLSIPIYAMQYPDFPFLQVPLAKISWYHHISLLPKVKDEAELATSSVWLGSLHIQRPLQLFIHWNGCIAKRIGYRKIIDKQDYRFSSWNGAWLCIHRQTIPHIGWWWWLLYRLADVASALPQIENLENSMDDLEYDKWNKDRWLYIIRCKLCLFGCLICISKRQVQSYPLCGILFLRINNLCIDLSCTYIGMTKHLAYSINVCTARQLERSIRLCHSNLVWAWFEILLLA